ncbi:MAG TPA: amino acid ABC transporter permease [Methylomirabilota bacterium]|nr:amino acid ABC transporter permease [Methylomirabilota bacterium]
MPTFDWSIVARYGPTFLEGAATTLAVSVVSTLIGVGLGFVTALARLSPWRPLRAAARAYVEVIRGTPLLVQLFFLYAALPLYGVRLSATASGVVALSLYTGAYAGEIFRAGLTAIHRGQVEAARSLGMSYGQTLRRIVAPIMAALVLPPLTNEFTGVIKWSSLLSIVTVPELTFAAYRAIGETYSAVEPLLVSGLLYWCLNDLVVAAGRGLERRLTRHLA